MPKFGRKNSASDVEHMLARNITTKNAPFGTIDTPKVRVKIVGGKPIHVIDHNKSDSDSTGNVSREQSRAATVHLNPLTEKPNEFNPNDLTEKKHWGFVSAQQDSHNSHIHIAQDKKLNPLNVLPPITNGHGHDTSSYGDHNNYNMEEETNYNQKLPQNTYLPREPLKLSKKEELQLLDKIHRELIKFDVKRLKDIYMELTSFDRQLTGWVNYQDLTFTLIRKQIYINPDTLRLIACLYVSPNYPGKVNYEKILSFISAGVKGPSRQTLEGQTSRERESLPHNQPQIEGQTPRELEKESLPQNQPWIDDTRRHPKVPMFKSPHEGMIMPRNQWEGPNLGYENQITKETLPQHREPSPVQTYSSPQQSPRQPYISPRDQKQQAMYYNPITQAKHQPLGNNVFHGDRGEGKLLRMVETQIQNSDFNNSDFEKLRMAFSQADRQYRRTFSKEQIKQLCYAHRLPLQESILDQIVERCDSSHDGQYHWEQFIKFLERVQPLETGLRIPPSKRPTEYVKHFPEPGPNWPLPETTSSPPVARETTPVHRPHSPQQKSYENDALEKFQTRKDSPVRYHEAVDPNDYLSMRSPRQDDLDRLDETFKRRKEIEDMEKQIQQLQSNYEKIKVESLVNNQQEEKEPWFDRYMKLADAIYRNDTEKRGVLKYDEVQWLIKEYNDVYNLKIPESVIDTTIQGCVERSGKVAIEPLLKALSLKDYD